MNMQVNDQARWQALVDRDRSRDGQFFYGVVTTGVYCRPSCPSRRPLQKNVRFFDAPAEAEAAGLRACKRCRPLESSGDPLAKRIGELCRYIEKHATESLSLTRLADQAHLSPFHLQRSFKAVVGVSPKHYVEAVRLRALKRDLREGAPVTRAIFDAGFGSTSRVYERMSARLGMTPKQYRRGGEGVAISYAACDTPLGLLMMGATDRGLCFVQFGDRENALVEQLMREYPAASVSPMPAGRSRQFEAWMQSLGEYLREGSGSLKLPLDLRGTAFQLKVWSYLQKIPSGELRSYAEVARGIGMPAAIRAVANACAANNVALLVPCHRVIRGDGALGGYRWGIERKRALIDRERAKR